MDSKVKDPLIFTFDELKFLHASVAELRADMLALQQCLLTQISTARVAFEKAQAENRGSAALAIASRIQEFDETIRKLKDS
ncbi:MAG TPA: hypothetical protein VMX16_00810 [Terriglobia bacterium]|nr:hypothetical protein [Terriglobia bacterium]